MAATKRKKSAIRDEYEIAKRNWREYIRCRDNGHLKYLEEARKFDRFYSGDQWDKDVTDRLDSEKRPWLTMNLVLSTVNTVSGEQRAQRADMQFKPKREGVSEVASALTKLTDHVLDENKFAYTESLVFDDGIIEDRGWFDVRMDFSDNLMGDIRITSDDNGDVLLDPGAREYDPNTWPQVVFSRWYELDEITELYGQEAANKLEALAGADEQTYGHDSVQYEVMFGEDPESMGYAHEDPDQRVKKVRVIERQYKKLHRGLWFVDQETGDMRLVPENWSKTKRAQFAKKFGLAIIPRVTRRIRWTVTADKFVLHDDWSPYPFFTKVPYFPYFRRGKPSGLVRHLISAQELVNKVTSQELHVVNTTANSGWVFQTGTLIGMTREDLEERGAETGLVLEVARGAEMPQKIQPNQIPTGLDRIGTKGVDFFREVSGISDALLGFDSPEVSGVAIEAKQGRGLVQMQVAFDNLQRTRSMLAERILYMLQTFYTETRFYRITNWESFEREQEDLTINEPTAEGEILNDLTLGEYDVVVASAPARDTFNESQFAEVLALRNAGVMIPDHWVLQYSNLDKKRQLAEEVMEMQGLGEPTEEELAVIQQQNELAMALQQLQVAELEAKVMKLEADAMLSQAKAQKEMSNTERQAIETKAQTDMARIEADLAIKRAEVMAKLKIASVNAGTRMEEMRHNTLLKGAELQIQSRLAAQAGRSTAPKSEKSSAKT